MPRRNENGPRGEAEAEDGGGRSGLIEVPVTIGNAWFGQTRVPVTIGKALAFSEVAKVCSSGASRVYGVVVTGIPACCANWGKAVLTHRSPKRLRRGLTT